jgi:hypothetical protein
MGGFKEPTVADGQSNLSQGIQQPAGGWILGFMAITVEQGYLGALLVTNSWGRPLEFRMTTSVNPNKVQQILYGPTLESHIVSELIGKALLDKAAVVPQMILTDHPLGLDMQQGLEAPVVFVDRRGIAGDSLHQVRGLPDGMAKVCIKQPNESLESRIASVFEALPSRIDLIDPFHRAQEAMLEARKLGSGSRAA